MQMHSATGTGEEVNLETYTRAQMARFAIEEGSRHGGVNNMLAICHVLRNRVFAGWGDWVDVCSRAAERRATIYPDSTPPNLKTNSVRILLSRVDEIYAKTDLADLSGGALFYMDQNYPVEDWFMKEVIGFPDEHKRTAHIGPVWFFK